MSTKPTIALARWADLVGSFVTPPTSGERDTGFQDATPAEADKVNDILKEHYLWALYLNDGALVGNHTIAGTLGVSSALTVTSGGLVVSAGGAAITGNSTVTGTLAVTSNETVGGTLGVTGAATVGGTLGVTGDLTVNGDTKHGPREIVVSASAFAGTGSYSTAVLILQDTWAFGAAPNDVIQANVPLRVGDRILSITWFFNKNTFAAALTMKLRKRNGTTNTDIDTLSDVSTGAAFTSVTRSNINSTIASGDATFLKVQAGSTSHQFSHAVISYDRP